MAFPTATLFDDLFTRADSSDSLGAAWSAPDGFVSGDGSLSIESNTASPKVTQSWKGNVYGTLCSTADQELWAIFAAVHAVATHGLYVRVQEAGTATPDGYGAEYTNGVISMGILANNTFSTLNGGGNGFTHSQVLAAGDGFGISCSGTTIEGWKKLGAGAWTSIGTFTNTTYSTGRNLGIEIQDATGAYDEVGGGDIVTGTPFVKPAKAIITGQSVMRAATRCVGDLAKVKGRIYIPRLWTPREALVA